MKPSGVTGGRRRVTSALAAALSSVLFALCVASSPAALAAGTPGGGERWTVSAGQTFNDGWRPLSTSATYLPCQTVRWSFDRSGEDPGRNSMIDDVRTGLAALQPLTGLTFTEAPAGSPSDLVFRWGDLTAQGHPNAAGYGGFTGWNKGYVTFDTKSDWTLNKWLGWDWRHLEWPRPDLGPGWYSYRDGPGRVALVIHESMHAMGFGHVEDFTSIMYPQGGLPNNQGKFSPGDLAGLRTVYLDRACTAPASAPATNPVVITPDAATAPATSVAAQKVAQGVRVIRSRVSPAGVMSATVATRLRRGSKVTIRVTSAADGAVTSTTRVVQTGGIVTFARALSADSTVELRDGRGRTLVTWRSAA